MIANTFINYVQVFFISWMITNELKFAMSTGKGGFYPSEELQWTQNITMAVSIAASASLMETDEFRGSP